MDKLKQGNRDLSESEEQGGLGMARGNNPRLNATSRPIAIGGCYQNQGTLFTLPPELRDEIYGYLLSSGDLSILRTSHQLSLEALRLIYEKGVLRIHVNSAQASRNIQLRDDVIQKFKNLELHWDLSDFDTREILDICRNQQAVRMACHVILETDACGMIILTTQNLSALRNLRVFRIVVLKTLLKEPSRTMSSLRLALLTSRNLEILKMLGKRLGQALGPADQKGNVDAPYLVFHPSRMLGERNNELPPSEMIIFGPIV